MIVCSFILSAFRRCPPMNVSAASFFLSFLTSSRCLYFPYVSVYAIDAAAAATVTDSKIATVLTAGRLE